MNYARSGKANHTALLRGWQKTIKPPQTSGKQEKYRAYFQQLIDTLRTKHRFTSAKIGQPQSWYSFSSGVNGVTYAACFAQGGKARAELYIDFGVKERNKALFDRLYEQRESIEPQFDTPLSWERLDDKKASRLALYIDGSIEDSAADLAKIQEWHITKLLKLKDVLGPSVDKLSRIMTTS